jgi:opacity protein-like surface antigen
MKKRILLIFSAVLLIASSYAATAKVTVSLTGSQLLINKQLIDSSATTQKVRQIMGAEHPRRLDGGALGFWYVYDESGLSFRWNADSTRLQYVNISYSGYNAPLYMANRQFDGSFSYQGAPVDETTSVYTMVNRSQGHIRSIKPDLYGISISQGSYTMQITYKPDLCILESNNEEHNIQRIVSCTIFTEDPWAYIHSCLNAKFTHDSLYINGKIAPEDEYMQPDFMHEPFKCQRIEIMRRREPMDYMFNTTEEDSLKRLVAFYSVKLKENNRVPQDYGDDKVYDEDAINTDGYSLLREGNFAGATALFKLNTLLYPDSYNVWDSYGEALFASGQPEKALKQYQTSINKNPFYKLNEQISFYNSCSFHRLIEGMYEFIK